MANRWPTASPLDLLVTEVGPGAEVVAVHVVVGQKVAVEVRTGRPTHRYSGHNKVNQNKDILAPNRFNGFNAKTHLCSPIGSNFKWHFVTNL